MFDGLDISKIELFIRSTLNSILATVENPLFWLQFAIIALVFGIAKKGLAPVLIQILDWFQRRSARVSAFIRVITAAKGLAIPFSWLFLQTIAISISIKLDWPHHGLTIVSSLLSAWLLIKLATLLIRNQTIANIIVLVAWGVAALNIFGLLAPTLTFLDSWAVNIGQTRLSPLTAIKVGVGLWIALWLANGLSDLLEKRLARSQSVSPSVRVLTAKVSRILFIAAAILITLTELGIDLTAFAVFSGALGVGLGFGLQKIFSNLVSGIILLMDHSIKPGDVISLGTAYGWINHLGARYTSVITRDGIEYLIPNEEMITQRVENWSFSDNLVRLRLPIDISYKSDPRLAINLCVEAAQMVPRVLLDPEPRCLLTRFADSSLTLELRFWINDPANGRGSVISDILLNVWDAFAENGVEIPYPQRDLHLKSIMGERDISVLDRLKERKTERTTDDIDSSPSASTNPSL